MKEYHAINILEGIYEDHVKDSDKEYMEKNLALTEAVKALSEIQQYRAIGTVEEINDILQIISDGQEDVDESGISTGLLHTLLEYIQYTKIGTVEECREARERQKPQIPNILGDGYDNEGNLIYNMYDCPNRGKSYEVDYHDYKYCPECGQAIDRSDLDKLV